MRWLNIVFGLVILAFFADICTAHYSITYSCPEECVHNRTIVFTVNIDNQGESELELLQIKIVDREKSKIAASEMAEVTTDQPENIGSNKTKAIRVEPGQSKKVNISAVLPKAKNSSIRFNYCETVRRPFHAWTKLGKTAEHCYPENYSIDMLGCTLDSDCSYNEVCQNNSCIALNCSYCEYMEHHECKEYQCCADEECELYESCNDNICRRVACKRANETINLTKMPDNNLTRNNSNITSQGINTTKQYLVNHSCSSSPCSYDEIIVNYSCAKAYCKEDEYLADYRCNKLKCSNSQYVKNHSCIELNCSFNETIINRTCVSLDCKYDEIASDHRCVSLNCSFFQKAEDHSCPLNTWLIIQLIMAVMIGILASLNYKKLARIRKKRTVSKMMKKLKKERK